MTYFTTKFEFYPIHQIFTIFFLCSTLSLRFFSTGTVGQKKNLSSILFKQLYIFLKKINICPKNLVIISKYTQMERKTKSFSSFLNSHITYQWSCLVGHVHLHKPQSQIGCYHLPSLFTCFFLMWYLLFITAPTEKSALQNMTSSEGIQLI